MPKNIHETPEEAERRRAKAREMKARSRAKQSKEQRDEERRKARLAMAKKRKEASPEEKAAMKAKAAARIKKMRENLTEEQREEVKAKDRARKAKKRMEALEERKRLKGDQVASAPEKMQVKIDQNLGDVENPVVEENQPMGQNMILDDIELPPLPPLSMLPEPLLPQAAPSSLPPINKEEDDDAMIVTPDPTDVPKEITEKRKVEEKELGAMVNAAFGVSNGENHWWQWL